MKLYLDREWLVGEYVNKGKTAMQIAKENNCTDANIYRVMKRFGIPRRKRKWTEEQIKVLLDYSDKYTFKEIAQFLDKTYDAIRIKASQLGIRSKYEPAIRDENTREKISASLQGLGLEDWSGYKETNNKLIRKSIAYKKWRTAVFERDNYTCQECGACSGRGRKVYLHADHIKRFAEYPELRLVVANGRTLCVDCHRATSTWGGRKVLV